MYTDIHRSTYLHICIYVLALNDLALNDLSLQFRKAVGALGYNSSQDSMDRVFGTIPGLAAETVSFAQLKAFLKSPDKFDTSTATTATTATKPQARGGRAETSKAKAVLEVEAEAERMQLFALAGQQVNI